MRLNNHKFLVFILVFSLVPSIHAQVYYADEVTTSVSPDCSYEALTEFLEDASSIYINIYTFTNPEIAEILANAKDKGADIILLIEKSPAGGMKDEEKSIIGFLSGKGVKVYLTDGDFRFNMLNI